MATAPIADPAPSSSSTANTPACVTTTTTSNPSLNGPDSEPVLYQPQHHSTAKLQYQEDPDPRCRSCHSTEIVTDWKQGDRICTNCGVVLEERIRDDRPEWRDFNDVEDIVKGLPNGARSGLVLVDESKYLGGLQPTRLSKHAFGGDNSLIAMGKRLKTTNKRLDQFMEKQHRRALQEAKLDRAIRLKHGNNFNNNNNNADGMHPDDTIRPEMDQLILQEEEDAHRLHAALYAEKWSLDRALLLHGTSTDTDNTAAASTAAYSPEQQEEREELLGRMDSTLRKASEDMYTAYTMLTKGAQKLHLPDRVRIEVVHRLVRFVTRRDGFFVKGVSSRLSKTHDPQQRKKAAEQLREYNKLKQMGALGAAILFLTARSLGWTRSVVEVCASLEPPMTSPIIQQQQQQQQHNDFIKPKHCSRAMTEIKSTFPEYGRVQPTPAAGSGANQGGSTPNHPSPTRGTSNDVMATCNFADHSLRRLQLPPVAEACARTLLLHCRDQQVQLGRNSGTKLSTLCAAVTYFVCTAGTIMQRLAQQTPQRQTMNKRHSTHATKRLYDDSQTKVGPRKRLKTSKTANDKVFKKVASTPSGNESDDSLNKNNKPLFSTTNHEDEEEPFDVFSHPPVVEDQTEKHKYEMRRMWDAWSEQMPWNRSVSEVEQSCGVSRNVVLEFYKTQLHPRREELLNVLSDAVGSKSKTTKKAQKSPEQASKSILQDTPLAPILLVHISTAAPLMAAK